MSEWKFQRDDIAAFRFVDCELDPATGVVRLSYAFDRGPVMVEAITAAVSHDGRVSVAEAELLRTICGVLHCPLPPMLERG